MAAWLEGNRCAAWRGLHTLMAAVSQTRMSVDLGAHDGKYYNPAGAP